MVLWGESSAVRVLQRSQRPPRGRGVYGDPKVQCNRHCPIDDRDPAVGIASHHHLGHVLNALSNTALLRISAVGWRTALMDRAAARTPPPSAPESLSVGLAEVWAVKVPALQGMLQPDSRICFQSPGGG